MSTDDNKALRLLGRVLTLSRLRVQSAIPQEIVEELTKLTLENPMLKQGLPVIIESDYDIDLAWLVKVLKKTGIQILGVANGILSDQAMALDLPILPPDHTQAKNRESLPKSATTQAAHEPPKLPAKMITDPVRSGQQVYAEHSDLVVLAPVSSGAELIADGCIHIYGALRGRAIAGATGNPNARIFCKRLEADLVAIAGVYMVADQIPKQLLGKSVQVKLGEDGNINIELLE
ncbi:MAG: septum site-determining protein MinC [Moraxellaceae bacterium]|nr:septum site-determining protein MinC [Pseudomonadales bacterium]MCP5176304.1 septum site-determining protein MinC [Moraxellaceae bacterium]